MKPNIKPSGAPQTTPDSSKSRSSHIPPWLESVAGFSLRFDRFIRDITGLFLLTISFLLLLGLLDISKGVALTPWVNLTRRWLGFGSYGLVILLILAGILILWRGASDKPFLTLGQVLSLEGSLFSGLAVLSLTHGHTVERAEQGLDGGYIGWGLAELLNRTFPEPIGLILFIFIFIYCCLVGFGFARILAHLLDRWLLSPENEPAHLQDGGIAPPENLSVTEDTALAAENAMPANVSPATIRSEGQLPPLNILIKEQSSQPDHNNIHTIASGIERTLLEFGVPARVVSFRVGPSVTQYAVEPGFSEKTGPDGQIIQQKVRVAQITHLQRDLALALSAERIRIEAPVPGQSFVGIEVPNERVSIVRLRTILESEVFQQFNASLPIAMGKNVSGQPVLGDLSRMPHLLIAGTTGSGKSVFIQSLILCLVMNNTPADLQLAMLDPKMVELTRYNGLPHLLGKVETEVERILGVLQWATEEMTRRYKLLETTRSRDIESYNRKMQRRQQPTLSRIVIVIDELADLMMNSSDQTEPVIIRLAQLARATGIHLVIATQRPSTDVVTGLIKANFPARVAFTVASGVDSRVILDTTGAETLLGRGDMLFLSPESGAPVRCQGVMVTDKEIERVVNFWQKNVGASAETECPWEDIIRSQADGPDDDLLPTAVEIVRTAQRASASLLQRRLRIGHPRAARLIDTLEKQGVIGPAVAGGKEREVFYAPDDGTDPYQDINEHTDDEI